MRGLVSWPVACFLALVVCAGCAAPASPASPSVAPVALTATPEPSPVAPRARVQAEITLIPGSDDRDTIVSVRDVPTGAEALCITVADVYREHYHNAEFHNGHLYVIRRLGHDGYPDEDWTDELWRYDAQGQGVSVYAQQGLDFRVAPDEALIAIRQGTDAIRFLDATGSPQHEFSLAELSRQDPLRPPPTAALGLLEWSSDSRAFWGVVARGPGAEEFFRIEPAAGQVTIHDVSALPIHSEYDLNADTAQVAYSDYPAIFDVESARALEEKKRPVTLFVHDLATGSTQTLATATAQRLRPRWIDDAGVEYDGPAGGRVVARLQPWPQPTPLPEADAIAIYAAAVRRLYTEDDSFGGSFRPPILYVLRRTDDAVGDRRAPRLPPATLSPSLQAGLARALGDLPTRLVWVDAVQDVPRDARTGEVKGHGMIVTLGNIRPQADGTVHVPASVYVASLAAASQTYVLEKADGGWRVKGNTGVRWIS